MAALSAPRSTKEMAGSPIPKVGSLGVAASTTIYQGSLVARNAAGYMVPFSTSTTLAPLGRARRTYNNSAGGNGAIVGEFETGVFGWVNNGASLDDGDIGSTVYGVDDQTVDATNGGSTRSAAGKLWKVEGTTAWVLTYPGVV